VPAAALVAGATGLVGHGLVKLLLDANIYARIYVLARRSTGLEDERLVEHVVDFEDLDRAGPLVGRVDHAFCALGTTIRSAGSKTAFRRVDHDFVLLVAEIAKAAGARSFVAVSSLGADPSSGNFYLRVKGETERDLESLGMPRLVILRPSLLTGDREEFRAGERAGKFVLGLVSPLLIGRLGRVRPVSDVEVAGAMLRLAAGDVEGTRIVESEEIRRIARYG
jgi:uncharacterized protein YbjT (DUF2867 family)